MSEEDWTEESWVGSEAWHSMILIMALVKRISHDGMVEIDLRDLIETSTTSRLQIEFDPERKVYRLTVTDDLTGFLQDDES